MYVANVTSGMPEVNTKNDSRGRSKTCAMYVFEVVVSGDYVKYNDNAWRTSGMLLRWFRIQLREFRSGFLINPDCFFRLRL